MQTPGLIGTVLLDRYEVLEQIGAGGMGVVYRARDRQAGTEVAAKVMASMGNEAQEHRLRREYRALQRVRHPNVVSVLGWGMHLGCFFYVMELVTGVTLDHYLPRPAAERGEACRADVERFLLTVATVLEALHAVHEAGIVHRDIKPQNIMVDQQGAVKLMDFGLVKGEGGSLADTVAGSVLGTVGYMAPEQVRGNRVDRRADLYGVGVILYEHLTGKRPFTGDNSMAILTRIVNERPTPPRIYSGWISSALEDLILRLLAKSPEERFATAYELASTLRRLAVAGAWCNPAEQSWSSGGFAPPRGTNRMVGRQELIDRLRGAAERALRGHGQLVVVAGEAGVGKSRLVEELPAQLPEGDVSYLRGVCYENEGVYYQPFLAALAEYRRLAGIDSPPRARVNLENALRHSFRHLQPELLLEWNEGDEVRAARNDPSEQMRLFDLAARFFTRLSRRTPLVLIMEDLQWADELTLELARFLARNLKGERILFVLTYRSEERVAAAHDEHLGGFLAAVGREGLVDLELKVARLDRESTAELSLLLIGRESLPDAILDAIHRHSDGNPYFVAELVKPVSEALAAGTLPTTRGMFDIPLPKSASDLVERQLSRVDEGGRRVLVLAALIGREFPFDVLRSLAQLGEDALLDVIDALIRQGVVEEVPGRDRDTYRFTMAITRGVLEREVNRRKARRVHSAIAQTMEDLYHDRFEDRLDEVVEEIARHSFLAREHSKALLYALAAGQKAAASYAHETAIRHLEMAHEVYSEAPELLSPEQATALTLHLGEAYERTGRLAQAREIYEELLEGLTDREQPLMSADLSLALAGVLESMGNFTAALEMVEHAHQLATGDADRSAAILRRKGDLWNLRGDGRAALEIYLDGLALAESLGNVDEQMLAMERVARIFLGNGEPREARKYLERAIEQARAGADRVRLAELLAAEAQVHHDLFDTGAEVACLEECLEIRKELGDQLGTVGPMGSLGRALVRRGDPSRGASLIEESLRRSRRYGTAVYEALRLRDLATLAVQRGEIEAGRAHLVQARSIAQRLRHGQALFLVLTDLALVGAELGRHDEALSAAGEARDLAASKRNVFWLLRAESVRAEVLFAARAGDVAAEAALAEAQRIASGLAELLPEPHFARLLLLKARALERAGDVEEARVQGERALAALAGLEPQELPHVRARVCSFLGMLLLRTGQVAAARPLLEQARACYQRLGNKNHFQQVDLELERILLSADGDD